MKPNQDPKSNPYHQPETESISILQEFEDAGLSPDDPKAQGRERKGRPDDRDQSPSSDN